MSDLINKLAYHKPTQYQTEFIELLRDAQKAYALVMERLCPPGRELSIAKTEFEASCMWAIKAIVLARTAAEAGQVGYQSTGGIAAMSEREQKMEAIRRYERDRDRQKQTDTETRNDV